MPVIETAVLLGACVSFGTGTITAPCWALPATRLFQRCRIVFNRFVTSYHAHQTGLDLYEQQVSSERRYVAPQMAQVLHALDQTELEWVMASEEQVTAADVEKPPITRVTMWRAAYRWSRRARIHFNMPTHSPSNKIIVSDWLRKLMMEEHVRPGQLLVLLPAAVMLTFVKSRYEREVDLVEDVLMSIPGKIERGRR